MKFPYQKELSGEGSSFIYLGTFPVNSCGNSICVIRTFSRKYPPGGLDGSEGFFYNGKVFMRKSVC